MVRAVDRVYTRLRADILDGVHPPGARIGEAELAEATGSSRTPVREALRRLEVEGLVEILPHRGARVPGWSPDDLEEIYELRTLLEAAAARRAATRIKPADTDRMDELCRLIEQAAEPGDGQDLDLVAELNAEFHGIVRAASASARLVSMLNSVTQLPLVMRTFHRYSRDDLDRSFAHHREMVAALRAGDGMWAESVIRAHVLAAKAVLMRSIEPEEPGLAEPDRI